MAQNMDTLDRIESHFSCSLPAGFRLWTERHYTDCHEHPDSYLWVNDAEWVPPAEITTKELFRDRHIPGLVPFAFTGGADYWCFNTCSKTDQSEFEIILCNTDEDADVYSPSFAGWFYRTCLEFAVSISADEVESTRQQFASWSQRMSELGNDSWSEHLSSIATETPSTYPNGSTLCFLTESEVDQIVAKELGSKYVDTQIPWGWYDE